MPLKVGELFAQIEVDNKAFDKGLDKAESSFRKTGKTMENDAKGIGQRIGQKLSDSISAGMKNIGRNMTMFLTLPLAAVGAKILKVGMDYEAAMSSIKSLGTNPGDMKKMDELALEMGAKTKFSALEAAQGIEELLKAGLTAEQVLGGGLKGALDLAAAGDLELADAAIVASTALNAFKKDGLNVTEAANILAGAANASSTEVSGLSLGLSQSAGVASVAGMSFRDTATALAIFAQHGTKGSDAGTSLKTMLMNLQPVTKTQIATMERLNLLTEDGSSLFYDEKGNMKSLAEIAGLLNSKMKHLTSQERLRDLEAMFGSDSIRAAGYLFEEGAAGVEAMNAAMSKTTAADVAKEKQNNLKGSLENMTGSLETLSVNLFKMESGPLKGLVDGLTVLINAFGNLPGPVQGTILIVGGLVAALGPLLWVMGTINEVALPLLIDTLLPALGTAFTALLGPVGLTIAIVAALVVGLGYLWNTSPKFRNWARNIAYDIDQFVLRQINGAVDAINKLIDAINMIPGIEIGHINYAQSNMDAPGQESLYETASVAGNTQYSADFKRMDRGYASGTNSARKGLAWVGERGPELVNFGGGETVLNNSQSMAAMGGSQTVKHTGEITIRGVNDNNQLMGVTKILAEQFNRDARAIPNRVSRVPSRA